jgi:hypothetical protein
MIIVVVVCLGTTQQDALEERNSSNELTLQFRRPSTPHGNLEAGGNELYMVEHSASTLALCSSDLASSHKYVMKTLRNHCAFTGHLSVRPALCTTNGNMLIFWD